MGIIAGAEAFAADMMIPDDGDDIEAGSVNIPFEALADRTKWLRSRCITVVEFLVDTLGWVAPSGAAYAIAMGCGGGGGGGGSRGGSTVDNVWSLGGGGGGGAQFGVGLVPLVAGDAYDIFIGYGGAGGAVATEGAVGGDTLVMKVATTYVQFRGAAGGGSGTNFTNTTEVSMYLGGGPVRESSPDEWVGWGTNRKAFIYDPGSSPFNASSVSRALEPGSGGASVGRANGRAGTAPANMAGQFAGGVGGGVGADLGLKRGGSGGGGGGAGPYGNGGAGGNAGFASAVAGLRPGAPGSAAGANSGAGGGGAGGGGADAAVPGVGAAGGAGAKGRLKLLVFGVR